MGFLWLFFSILFYLSLTMVALSVFTPRTAIFFRIKTRARGALLWMIMLGVAYYGANEFAAPQVNAPSVPASSSPSSSSSSGPALSPGELSAPGRVFPRTAELPAYRVEIEDAIPGNKLSLECVLAEAVSLETLRALGERVYADYKGPAYKKVYIIWYIPGYRKGAGAWGVTHRVDGKWEVGISALQS
ncbi:hypothetical protein LJC59_05325 [Desulfovibrio sp. OttesenSCG-928-A18]|nr:hypothetical protein [Desulfovibrio sp. OttesenSCG-928-A18]